MYLNGHRNWIAGEFEQLVTVTTARVNSRRVVTSGSASNAANGTKRAREDRSDNVRPDKKPRHGIAGADRAPHIPGGQLSGEEQTICRNWHMLHNKCFKCHGGDHNAKSCRAKAQPWKMPDNLDRKKYLPPNMGGIFDVTQTSFYKFKNQKNIAARA